MNHDIDRTQVGFGPESGSFPHHSGGSVFHEEEQTTLASGLMEVNDEEELDYFLGDVISGATQAIGDFINSPTGQALGSGLKDVAKQALPAIGTALGSRLGPVGGQVGGALGTAAAGLLNEVEPEALEWEAANTFVKLAGEAAKKAAEAPSGADPHAVAKQAIIEAAKIHAPGLASVLASEAHGMGPESHHHHHHRHEGHHHHHSGRWYRHDQRIILEGV